MAITVNNRQTSRSETNGTSFTLASYEVAAAANRVLVVRVSGQRNSESDFTFSVTFNSVSMTQAVTVTASGTSRWWRSSIFYLIAPDETTANIVVTSSASLTGVVIAAETLQGAAQTSLIGQTGSDTSTSGETDTTFTLTGCSSNSRIMALVGSNCNTAPTWAWTSPMVEEYDLNGASDATETAGSGAGYETSGGDVTVTATRSASQVQVAVGAEFKAAAVSGTVVPIFAHYYRQLAEAI